MRLRTIRPLLWTIMLLPLAAAPARASSITTYGVIITSLGNDLQVQYLDQAQAEAAATGSAPISSTGTSGTGSTTSTGAGSASEPGLLITPNGSGGFSVLPYGGFSNSTTPGSSPTGTGSMGGSSGGGGGSTSGGGAGTSSGAPIVSVPPSVAVTSTVPVLVPSGSQPDTPITDGGVTSKTSGGSSTSTAKTPEPASITLLSLAGMCGLGLARRRQRA